MTPEHSQQLRPAVETVDVAFITVNYNTRQLLEELVGFLTTASLPFTRSVTVVDNNSTDGSLDDISSNPLVNIIRNERNLGYGAAANKGVHATNSKYVCVLNTDVILNLEALLAIWQFMETKTDAGMCTPVVRYGNDRVQVFAFNFSLMHHYCESLAKLWVKCFKWKLARCQTPAKIEGIAGAFLFLRRKFIDTNLLFDEDFFFYFEDTDLAYRWSKRGIASYVLPDHSIVHLGGQSGSGRNNILYYKGKYIFISKHYGESTARWIKKLDVWRIRKRVATYWIASLLFPTRKITQKLSSYSTYLNSLKTDE